MIERVYHGHTNTKQLGDKLGPNCPVQRVRPNYHKGLYMNEKMKIKRHSHLRQSPFRMYYIPLADFLGSINAAIFFQIILDKEEYFEENGMLINDTKNGDGWLYLTRDVVQKISGMKIDAQEGAVKTLVESGLIEFAHMGIPAKRHFRINHEKLDEITEPETKKRQKNFTRSGKSPAPPSRQNEKPDDEKIAENDSKKLYYKRETPLLAAGNPATAHIYDEIKDEKKKKIKKEKVEKIKFRDSVELTQEEHDKLLAEHGKEKFDQMLDKLNSYKASHGKQYDSDYHTMINGGWVRREIEKELQQGKIQAPVSAREYALQIQKEYESPYAYIEISYKAFEIIPTQGADAHPIIIPFNENGFKDQIINALQKKNFRKKNLPEKPKVS